MKLLKKAAWLLAASGITFAVIVVSIIVYQYTAMQPRLPSEDDCTLKQMVQTADRSAEVRHYFCARGEKTQWQGHELWLVQPDTEDWQRMLTTRSANCLKLHLQDQTLHLIHDGERMEMNLAEPVFLYRNQQGQSVTLAVDIEKQPREGC
ncbi:hypothetical protein LG288_06980 [Idiomarina seosinensis]|uniref:hypothetical protein n=1 Tax=Idiomarina seosinensis TaxID=281739 RepID=UPI00384B4A18